MITLPEVGLKDLVYDQNIIGVNTSADHGIAIGSDKKGSGRVFDHQFIQIQRFLDKIVGGEG